MSGQTEGQPLQHQDQQPGSEAAMDPAPRSRMESWRAANKLAGRTALISGGDSGIGRAVAIGFAKEGADVVILHKNETDDAEETRSQVEAAGRRCMHLAGDIGGQAYCAMAAERAAAFLGGKIDILVNNAAEQHANEDFAAIPIDLVEQTFKTNILGMMWLTRVVLPLMPEGGAIINTTSITAYKGQPQLVDYASTKGANVAFTRSLASSLWPSRKIRVNAVAPGPIWTPLIPASFDDERVAKHGTSVLMKRAGQPNEVAPCYLFLAAEQDSSYMTGQVLHPNGGSIVNG